MAVVASQMVKRICGADLRQHVQVRDVGIAAVGVVLVRVVNCAVHVFESHGDAGAVVVLEYGNIDEHVRGSSEDL